MRPEISVTVDIVIFTLREGDLQVLLVKRKHPPYEGRWAIPGGYVEADESLEAAAARELFEETHVQGMYIEQLYTFGEPLRDPRGRVVTVAYFALLPAPVAVEAGDDAVEAQWKSVAHLPAMAFDHDQIVAYALKRVRAKLDRTSYYPYHGGTMSNTITSVERVQTVLDGGIPDRVPVTLHNFMMAALATGMPFPEYFQNGEAMAEGMLRAWREFGHDMVILENGTAALAQACGCQVEYLKDSAPVLTGSVLNSLDDIDKLTVPDPHNVHPLPELLKATRIVTREIGNQAYIMGRADQGPFSLASMLLGVDQFLMALTDPDNHAKLHRLLQFSMEVVYRYAVAQGDAGARMTSIGESLAGPDVSSPRIYREFEWTYARQLAERLKTHHLPLAYHICGNATRIAYDMAATGAAVLELDYKCDLPTIKDASRGKCAILGVIDPSSIMALGTPDQVTQHARENIEILGTGGGLILSPGCALPPTTPPENVHALVAAAKKYGRYR